MQTARLHLLALLLLPVAAATADACPETLTSLISLRICDDLRKMLSGVLQDDNWARCATCSASCDPTAQE
jgi:hypothetical protein